jgi:hypothetical protein
VAFEQKKLLLPGKGRNAVESRVVQDLEAELFNFEPTVSKSGTVRYAAAGSYHDDLVMALSLAWSGALRSREPMVTFVPFAARTSPGEVMDPFNCGPERWWRTARRGRLGR